MKANLNMSPKVRLGLMGAGVWGSSYIKTIEQIEGVILKKIVCKNHKIKRHYLKNMELQIIGLNYQNQKLLME